MPTDNRISAELAVAAKSEILTKLLEIKALLPFLINLSPDERRRIPSIGNERTGMVTAFYAQMTEHPAFVASYIDINEVTKDLELREALLAIHMAVTETQEAVSDTLQVVGSDLYMAFMSYYASVQEAAKRNVIGADTVLADLKRFIPRGRRSTNTAPTA